MKKRFIFLTILGGLIISCNTGTREDEKRVNISFHFNDYKINEKAVEENRIDSIVVNGIPKKEFASTIPLPPGAKIDSAWRMPRPIINEIPDDGYLVLQYRSQGCFGRESKTVVVKRIGWKIYCIPANNLAKQLTDSQVPSFIRLESLLSQVDRISYTLCTTRSSYRFYLGNRLRTYINNTCEYNSLLQSLIDNVVR